MARSENPGFRVFTEIPRVSPELVAEFRGLATVYVSDAMNRSGGMIGDIRPAFPGATCAGQAVTVRVPPHDTLMVFRAFEVAHPGDVIVIESRGYTSVAQWGDLMSLVAKQLGLGGMVTDGSLRDVTGISESGFPVFAQSVITPNGAIKDGPGEVNVPVAVGGVPVLPGDIVVGDSHGVVVVPRKDARVVVSRARANVAAETLIVERIKSGRIDEDWLRPAAKIADAKGCEVVGGTWIDQKEGA